jgi:hypothetical protein
MIRETEIKLQILRESCDVKEGTGLAWHKDRIANEVAVELIDNGLVLGSVSDAGTLRKTISFPRVKIRPRYSPGRGGMRGLHPCLP